MGLVIHKYNFHNTRSKSRQHDQQKLRATQSTHRAHSENSQRTLKEHLKNTHLKNTHSHRETHSTYGAHPCPSTCHGYFSNQICLRSLKFTFSRKYMSDIPNHTHVAGEHKFYIATGWQGQIFTFSTSCSSVRGDQIKSRLCTTLLGFKLRQKVCWVQK